jgi:hypothetical protein
VEPLTFYRHRWQFAKANPNVLISILSIKLLGRVLRIELHKPAFEKLRHDI